MITNIALPRPEFIESALSELRSRKTLKELKHLGSENRIRVWTDDASSMTVSSLVKIAEYAEELDLDSMKYWKETLFAEDYKTVTIRKEWHEPHMAYVCERLPNVPAGWLIICQNELCRYHPNSLGEPHALSFHNNELYKMDAPPDHHVIGKLTPIKEEELPWDFSTPYLATHQK